MYNGETKNKKNPKKKRLTEKIRLGILFNRYTTKKKNLKYILKLKEN